MVRTRSSFGPVDFQGRHPGEQFQFYFRQHWIRMIWPFARTVLFTLLLALTGFLTFFFADITEPVARHGILLLLLVFLAIVQFDFLIRFYRYFLYVTVVTDRSVHRIKKTMLTIDDHESIDLSVLQDVNKSQRGLFQNLLGFGTLTLEAQESMLRIHFTPRITERHGELMRLRQLAQQGGQHPERRS